MKQIVNKAQTVGLYETAKGYSLYVKGECVSSGIKKDTVEFLKENKIFTEDFLKKLEKRKDSFLLQETMEQIFRNGGPSKVNLDFYEQLEENKNEKKDTGSDFIFLDEDGKKEEDDEWSRNEVIQFFETYQKIREKTKKYGKKGICLETGFGSTSLIFIFNVKDKNFVIGTFGIDRRGLDAPKQIKVNVDGIKFTLKNTGEELEVE